MYNCRLNIIVIVTILLYLQQEKWTSINIKNCNDYEKRIKNQIGGFA